MDTVRRESRWVTGCSHTYGGSGDPSPVTAYGVLQGHQGVLHSRSSATPTSRDGRSRCRASARSGTRCAATSSKREPRSRSATSTSTTWRRRSPTTASRPSPSTTIHKLEVDIFAPCALGGVINDDTISEFRCKIIAGAANNQLAGDEHGDKLRDLGILYAPDFVINAGGLINVEDELRGYDRERAMQKVEGIYKAAAADLHDGARERSISTARAAIEYAEERIRKISRIRLVRVTEFGPLSAH